MTDLPIVSAAPGWRLSSKPGVLSVSLLGGISLNFAGRDIRINGRKARAILAYLALSSTGEEARERLAGLLWSESNEEKARATLRQVIHGLREALLGYKCDALRPMRLTVGLDRDTLRVDVAELLRAVQAGEAPEVLLRQQRLPDSLLAGFEDLDPAFHVWLLARRQALHDQLMRALEDGYRNAASPRQVRRRLAAAAQRLDPTHEEACRVFMQCAAQEGDTAAALRAYSDIWTLLEQDYDCEPSIPTQELVADIKLGKYDSAAAGMTEEVQRLLVAERAPAPAKPHPTPPPRTAVQVAAVGATGVSQDRMHLVTGFRHELIACLVRTARRCRASHAIWSRRMPTRPGPPSTSCSRCAIARRPSSCGANALNCAWIAGSRRSSGSCGALPAH
jgi:DNA-binding SARP family transcriptional activator